MVFYWKLLRIAMISSHKPVTHFISQINSRQAVWGQLLKGADRAGPVTNYSADGLEGVEGMKTQNHLQWGKLKSVSKSERSLDTEHPGVAVCSDRCCTSAQRQV